MNASRQAVIKTLLAAALRQKGISTGIDLLRTTYYANHMIASYANSDTGKLGLGVRVKKFEGIAQVARRKLALLQAAVTLEDLRVSPGNRLEPLSGNRRGQQSIRVNDQYRICFEWKDGNAHEVEIVDYHS